MTSQPLHNHFVQRLSSVSEQNADAALLSMSKLRDELVIQNERVAAEHVESAMQSLQDACRGLLGKAA
jgi:histidinol dehydrogenase